MAIVDFFLRAYHNHETETQKRIKSLLLAVLLCFLITTAALFLQFIKFLNIKIILALFNSYIVIFFLLFLIKLGKYNIANLIFNISVVIIISTLQISENRGVSFDIYRHTASLLFGLFLITLVSSKKIQPIIYSIVSIISFALIILHNVFFFNMKLDKDLVEAIVGSTTLIILCYMSSIIIMSMAEERMERIKKSNLELIKLNQIKTNSNHLMSHELKSPISCIYGFANIVNDFFYSADKYQYNKRF